MVHDDEVAVVHIEATEMLAGALGVEDVVEDNKGGATGVFSCT